MRRVRPFARPESAPLTSFCLAAFSLLSASPAPIWAQEGEAPPESPPAETPPAVAEASDAPGEAKDAEEVSDADAEKPATDDSASGDDPPANENREESSDDSDPSQETADPSREGEPVAREKEPVAEEKKVAPPEATPDPVAPAPSPAPSVGLGDYPNPVDDKKDLERQGVERPDDVRSSHVYAEEWWSHTRPTLELHGNFRVRTAIYHNFHLGRFDTPESSLWPRPLDHSYGDVDTLDNGANLCTPDETDGGASDSAADANLGCNSNTQGGANMRFRLEPSIIISDNLRIRSQIDLLDNLVLGSTPQGNSNFPAATGGYAVNERSGYLPVSGYGGNQAAPVSGINSLNDSITVKRAWAEYETPVGELKFGRMPDHWGLGILYNAGDDIDGDYQSTVDRIAFTTGIPSWSLYVGGAWDFADEGATSAAFTPEGGQSYDLSQNDDVSRLNLMVFRRMDPQLERLSLKKGNLVVNGGMYLTYRYQRLANDFSGNAATCSGGADALGCGPGEADLGYARRGMHVWTPDLYGELKYKKFYAGLEVVTHQGSFESLATGPEGNDFENPNGENGWRVNQWAFAGEIEQKLVEDRLKLAFHFGWSSGDGDVDSLLPGPSGQNQNGDRSIETFRFHPGYRVDLILNRHILSRVQGSYYFKPEAQYDFIRKDNGLRLGGRASATWTRASQFMQTPGHARDLGIELNGTIYFQSKDGVLNTREDLTGGFYSMIQYGVLFPLSGLSYQANETQELSGQFDLKTAQMVRGFLGVAF